MLNGVDPMESRHYMLTNSLVPYDICQLLCGPSFPALFSTVLMSPERGCEAPQLVVAAGPDGGHGRRGGEQGQVPHQPAYSLTNLRYWRYPVT